MTTHHLITFLGRAERTYTKTTYLLAGETLTGSFFGLKLAEHIRPGRLLILGTSGSMWDSFIDFLEPDAEDDIALHERLRENSLDERVDDAALGDLRNFLGRKLRMNVDCRIVPYGRTFEEQLQILDVISTGIAEKDRVTLDVTHGFRHLPMLALLSALYLRSALDVQVEHLYYGARDMSSGIGDPAPVLDLAGLMHLSDWISMLGAFSKDGDFGAFGPLLLKDGATPELLKAFYRSSHLERIFADSNLVNALPKARELLAKETLRGVSALFKDRLLERLDSAKGESLYVRRIRLAELYRNRRDWARSVLFAFESFNAYLIEMEGEIRALGFGKVVSDAIRDEGVKKLYELCEKGTIECTYVTKSTLKHLRLLRNAIAHGDIKPEIREILENPDKVDGVLAKTVPQLRKQYDSGGNGLIRGL